MKLFRSTLSKRYSAIVCLLIGACVSPVLIQCIQSSVRIAKANDDTTVPQGKGTGMESNAQAPVSTIPAGEDEEKAESISSDPKEVTIRFVKALKHGDGATAWGLLSTRARTEMKWNGSNGNLLNLIGLETVDFEFSTNALVEQDGGAFVPCIWTSFVRSEQSVKQREFTWKLRWERNGWRIMGYVIDPKKNPQTKDFEQPTAIDNSFLDFKSTLQQNLSSQESASSSFGNSSSTIYPAYSSQQYQPTYSYQRQFQPNLPIQNLPSTKQDFALDAEIDAEIQAMMSPASFGNPSTFFMVSGSHFIEVKTIEHKGSGLETYSQIQDALNRAAALYQGEKDEAGRSELHAFSTKLAGLLFRLQQLKRKSEIGGVEMRLEKLREIVAAREKMSEQIVNNRVNQVLGIADGMGWDDLGIQRPSPAPYYGTGPSIPPFNPAGALGLTKSDLTEFSPASKDQLELKQQQERSHRERLEWAKQNLLHTQGQVTAEKANLERSLEAYEADAKASQSKWRQATSDVEVQKRVFDQAKKDSEIAEKLKYHAITSNEYQRAVNREGVEEQKLIRMLEAEDEAFQEKGRLEQSLASKKKEVETKIIELNLRVAKAQNDQD